MMKKYLNLMGVFLLMLLFSENILAAENFILDYRSGANLKNVFDSGLRPWRMTGFEKSMCEVRDVNVSILLPTGKKLPQIPAVRGEFFVYQGDTLGRTEFTTKNLSLSEARALVIPFVQLQNEAGTQLEIALGKVEADYLGHNPDFSIGDKGNPSWGVFFRKSYNRAKPVKLGLVVDWHRSRKEEKFRETRIEAPSGYENVSMDAPPRASSQPTIDNSTPIPDRTTRDLTSLPTSKAEPSLTPQTTVRSQSSSVLLIVTGILLLLAVAGFIFYLRKR